MAIPEKRPISATDPECKLLGLPAELRNRIYTLALVNDETFDITERHRTNVDRVEPGLLATCRQVRDEALSIFYGGNTFAGAHGDSKLVHAFLKHLPPAKLQLLKQVRRTIIDSRALWGGPEWPDDAKQLIRRCARAYGIDKTYKFLVRSSVLLQPVQLIGTTETLWVSLDRLDEFLPVRNGKLGLQYMRKGASGASR